jgi:hypothetical protein
MESLRLLSNIYAALTSLQVSDVEHSIIMQSTPDFMMSVQVKKGRFTKEEQLRAVQFARDNGIAMQYLPDQPMQSRLDDFLRAPDKATIIANFPRDITPTDDDRPYFFNFTRWSDPLHAIGHIDDIPAISQGNPFFILTQLLLSILLSVALIVWPISRRGTLPKTGALRVLGFFSALGVGFISIEVAVMQKLTLLLGQPVYSLTVTLFSLLIFTGLGSLQLARRVQPGSRSVWVVPVALALYIAAINGFSHVLVRELIAAALPLRIAASVALLAPLGLLLGIPFAYGLRVAHAHDPRLTPWAWAVNGCLSVVGSILTVVVSMNFGFSAVLWFAAVIYLLGFALLNGLKTAAATS